MEEDGQRVPRVALVQLEAPLVGLLKPFPHIVQLPDRLTEEVPGGHISHETIPASLKLPALQAMHDDSPADGCTVPASQSVQLAARAPENCPGRHLLQFDTPPPLKYPGKQS